MKKISYENFFRKINVYSPLVRIPPKMPSIQKDSLWGLLLRTTVAMFSIESLLSISTEIAYFEAFCCYLFIGLLFKRDTNEVFYLRIPFINDSIETNTCFILIKFSYKRFYLEVFCWRKPLWGLSLKNTLFKFFYGSVLFKGS